MNGHNLWWSRPPAYPTFWGLSTSELLFVPMTAVTPRTTEQSCSICLVREHSRLSEAITPREQKTGRRPLLRNIRSPRIWASHVASRRRVVADVLGVAGWR